MNTTENYGLKKPEKNEYVSVDIINENMDMVDKTMKEQDEKKVDSIGGDTAETVVSAFETSSESFPVPAAKEKAKTRWGKIKKFGEDFRAWMTGVCLLGHIVNNCVTNNPNLPLSAAQGKALMDLYTVLNTKLTSSYSVNVDLNEAHSPDTPLWLNGYDFKNAPWTLASVVEYIPYSASYGLQRITAVQSTQDKYYTAWRVLDAGMWSKWVTLNEVSQRPT